MPQLLNYYTIMKNAAIKNNNMKKVTTKAPSALNSFNKKWKEDTLSPSAVLKYIATEHKAKNAKLVEYMTKNKIVIGDINIKAFSKGVKLTRSAYSAKFSPFTVLLSCKYAKHGKPVKNAKATKKAA